MQFFAGIASKLVTKKHTADATIKAKGNATVEVPSDPKAPSTTTPTASSPLPSPAVPHMTSQSTDDIASVSASNGLLTRSLGLFTAGKSKVKENKNVNTTKDNINDSNNITNKGLDNGAGEGGQTGGNMSPVPVGQVGEVPSSVDSLSVAKPSSVSKK